MMEEGADWTEHLKSFDAQFVFNGARYSLTDVRAFSEEEALSKIKSNWRLPEDHEITITHIKNRQL